MQKQPDGYAGKTASRSPRVCRDKRCKGSFGCPQALCTVFPDFGGILQRSRKRAAIQKGCFSYPRDAIYQADAHILFVFFVLILQNVVLFFACDARFSPDMTVFLYWYAVQSCDLCKGVCPVRLAPVCRSAPLHFAAVLWEDAVLFAGRRACPMPKQRVRKRPAARPDICKGVCPAEKRTAFRPLRMEFAADPRRGKAKTCRAFPGRSRLQRMPLSDAASASSMRFLRGPFVENFCLSDKNSARAFSPVYKAPVWEYNQSGSLF